jgi:hypothetical protein
MRGYRARCIFTLRDNRYPGLTAVNWKIHRATVFTELKLGRRPEID